MKYFTPKRLVQFRTAQQAAIPRGSRCLGGQRSRINASLTGSNQLCLQDSVAWPVRFVSTTHRWSTYCAQAKQVYDHPSARVRPIAAGGA